MTVDLKLSRVLKVIELGENVSSLEGGSQHLARLKIQYCYMSDLPFLVTVMAEPVCPCHLPFPCPMDHSENIPPLFQVKRVGRKNNLLSFSVMGWWFCRFMYLGGCTCNIKFNNPWLKLNLQWLLLSNTCYCSSSICAQRPGWTALEIYQMSILLKCMEELILVIVKYISLTILPIPTKFGIYLLP